MSKYQNGKIYKIVDVGYNKCYIGSTCEELSQRMARHRHSYNTYLKLNKNLERSHLLFDEFGIENCQIILVEAYPCNSREEFVRKEGEHIKTTECVNKYIAGRTVAEYESENKEQRLASNRVSMKKPYERNLEKFIRRAKDYYKNHTEEISQKDKARYEANKDSVLKKLSEKMIRECGVTYTHGHRARHQRTQRHQHFLHQQQTI